MRRTILAAVVLLLAGAAIADVEPLPRSQWPQTVAQAVPRIVAVLTPAQRSIVQGTPRENLFMLQGEWGEDIERLLGLDAGNTALATAACGRPCSADRATMVLMEAAWEALAR